MPRRVVVSYPIIARLRRLRTAGCAEVRRLTDDAVARAFANCDKAPDLAVVR